MDAQLSLPLDLGSMNIPALRLAWQRSRLPVPFQVAMQDRAYAICLRCLADAMRRKRHE